MYFIILFNLFFRSVKVDQLEKNANNIFLKIPTICF